MKPSLPDELIVLIQRYCQLGRLLPTEYDFDTDDAMAVTEARLVLQEMTLVKSEMDAFWRAPSTAKQHLHPANKALDPDH